MIQIPVLFARLFTVYSLVSENNVGEDREKLRAKCFPLTESIIVIFNEIEDLYELATVINIVFILEQTINLGLKCIKNTHDFEKGLSD